MYVGYGIFAFVASMIFWKFILGGLLGPFFKVKRSRGKLLLARIRHPIQDYFVAAEISEGFLVFKDRKKEMRRIPMVAGCVYRAATINWIEVDDEKNCIFKRDSGAAVPTYDANKTDSLLTRCLYKPGLLGDNFVKIVLVFVIVLLIAVLVVGYLTYKNGQNTNAILQLLQATGQAAGVGVVQ